MSFPRWKIIHIGCLSHNPYWGEDDARRASSCTCTYIQAGNRQILVDPAISNAQEFEKALDERSGLAMEDIDTVFLTHFHRCHWRGLCLFPKSVWLMSRAEIRWWQNAASTTEEEQNILSRIVPIEEHRLPEIDSLSTPGHSHGLTSLIFETREGSVVVAGDAVLTFEHFQEREPAGVCEDYRQARRSMDRIAKLADLVIPGHGNFFVV